jgi:hypothetical protein
VPSGLLRQAENPRENFAEMFSLKIFGKIGIFCIINFEKKKHFH